ncbi:MAG: NAD(P)/FAD-dependent oxidoreductase [archaeon]
MNTMHSIAIIGAGPAGLATAMRLKEEGFDSSVLEEHEKVGLPEHCSGLISKKGVVELGLHLGDSLQNEVKGAKIFSPNGTMVKVERPETVAYVVDRKKFDLMLLRRARLMNIHVATHTKLIDIRKNPKLPESTLFVQVEGRGELRKAEHIIGADGAMSMVRHLMGVKTNKDQFVHTMQATCTGKFDKHFVHIYFGDYSKGFFAWMIPIGEDKAKIGLGSSLGDNIADSFDRFLKDKFPGVTHGTVQSALIPCGAPLSGITKNNVTLVGDSAFHTKATTGGGVIFGIKSGNILAETLADVFNGKAGLNDYEKRLAPLYKELRMHWKLRRYANSISNEEMDKLFMKLKEKGIEEFLNKEGDMDSPSTFIGKLATNPKYWFMAKTLIDIARA